MKNAVAGCVVALTAMLALSVNARVFVSNGDLWKNAKWTDISHFAPERIPGAQDTYDNSRAADKGIDLTGATDPCLNRLVITNGNYPRSVIGGSLKFCGNAEVVYWPQDINQPLTFDYPVVGEGENKLLLNFNGYWMNAQDTSVSERANQKVYFGGAFGNLAEVRQLGGYVYFTNEVGKVGVDGGDYRLNCGRLYLQKAGAHTIDKLTLEGSMNYLNVYNGETLTIKNLDSLYGATVKIVPEGGAAALGDTIKIFITGYKQGTVDGRFVYREDDSDNTPNRFFKYDLEKGLVLLEPSDYEAFDPEKDSFGVISNDGPIVISKNTTVKGIIITGVTGVGGVQSALTVDSVATLTLDGDGAPGFVYIFDPSKPGNTKSKQIHIDGGGIITAGDKTAMFWLDIARDDSWQGRKWTYFKTRVEGSNGICFADYPHSHSTAYLSGVRTYSSMFGYTGAMRFSGTGLRTENSPNDMPPEAYVESAGSRAASIIGASGISNKVRTKFHLSGCGISGALNQLGNGVSVYGAMEIEGYTRVCRDNAGNSLRLMDPITGSGSLNVDSFAVEFRADNTFTGRIVTPDLWYANYASRMAQFLTAYGDGNFGAGDTVVTIRSEDGLPWRPLCYTNTTGVFRGNIFSKIWPFAPGFTGDMGTKYAKATFLKTAHFSSVVLPREMKLVTGGELVFGAYTNTSVNGLVVLSATNDCGRIVANVDGDDREERMTPIFKDSAECPLSFEKRGSGTFVLDNAGYHGETVVKAGTLKFAHYADILSSPYVSYHLDAAKNVTVDENGKVTEWASCNGNGVSFVDAKPWQSNSVLPIQTAEEVRGTKLVRFNGTDFQRLYVNRDIIHRTVFMVLRLDKDGNPTDNFGLLGKAGADFGIRGAQGTGINASIGGAHIHSVPIRKDGVDQANVSKFEMNDGQLHLLTVCRDLAEDGAALFTPVLGKYTTWQVVPIKGDFAEILVFDIPLDDADRNAVERALAAKWGIAIPDAEVAENGPKSFTGGGPMTIADGATVDLGGAHCEVAALHGTGTLTTPANKPATLVVASSNDFAGVVTGPVTVKVGGCSLSRAIYRDGAALALSDGAELTIRPRWSGTITNGVVLHVDASAEGTVEYDQETMIVSKWNRFEGEGSVDLVPPNPIVAGASKYPPKYVADGLEGKPAVWFNHYDDAAKDSGTTRGAGLQTSDKVKVRTIFFVCLADTDTTGSGVCVMGLKGNDRGFRNGYLGTAVDIPTRMSLLRQYTAAGGWKDYSSPTADKLSLTENKVPMIVAVDVPEWHYNLSDYNGGNHYLLVGGYFNPCCNLYQSEIIVYDRQLEPHEVDAVGEYLVKKWFDDVEPQSVFDETSGPISWSAGGAKLNGSLMLAGDTTYAIDVKDATTVLPLVVNGDLSVGFGAKIEYLNYFKLPLGYEGTGLEVTGEVGGGELGVVPVDGRYATRRDGNSWKISHPGFGGVILIR